MQVVTRNITFVSYQSTIWDATSHQAFSHLLEIGFISPSPIPHTNTGFSESLLASIMRSSPDAIMVLAPVWENGSVVDFEWKLLNMRAEEMMDVTVEELQGRRLSDEGAFFSDAGLIDDFRCVVESDTNLRQERRFPHAYAGWLSMRALCCEDDLVVLCRDITEQKTADHALRQSERRFRMLAKNMTDLVCMHDVDGTFLYVSPSSRRILKYLPHELEGKNSYDLVHPEDVKRLKLGAHRQVLENKSFAKVEYRVQRKDGSYIWVESTTKPIRDETGSVYQMLTSSRNITDKKRAETALEQSNEELALRNRELQDFAYVASHDLQEPLRKVRAFADLMREDYGDVVDDTGLYYLDRMQDGARRMSDLISDLLAYSRITTQGDSFEDVSLNIVASEVLQDLELQIRDTEGTVHVGDLGSVKADPVQMRQLLQNLISNGLKFRRDDTAPIIHVSADTKRFAPQVDVTEDQVAFCVSDNGIGFEEKYADRIFTPFQRLHGRGEYKGTGMGLAICRRIVERHHGHISLSSTPGEGTTFVVQLPMVSPKSDIERTAE